MFYIKQLIFSGEEKETSSIEFENKANIIFGPSNTGKTYIAETIDFMFGGSEYPIDEKHGFTRIEMVVHIDDGSIRIIRELGKNDAEIISDNPNIRTDRYPIKSENKETLSDVWLKLLGIQERVQIFATETLSKKTMTTRVFSNIFIVKEDDIHSKATILVKPKVNKTYLKSALLYLLNNDNYIEEDDENLNIKKTKRKALREYLESQLQYISEQKTQLENSLYINPEDFENKIQLLLNDIQSNEAAMNNIILESKEIASQIILLNEKLSELLSLQKKYVTLHGQYESDVRRLKFMIDGDIAAHNLKKTVRCPFCNGELEKREEESCIEAALIEIRKLTPKIKDLEEAENDIKDEINSINEEITVLESEKKKKDFIINKELLPKIEELKNQIKVYSTAIEIAKESAMLLKFEANYKEKLSSMSEEENDEEPFEPNTIFGPSFVSYMNRKLDEILSDSNYDNYESSYFDMESTFDVVVNGTLKKKQGKGYRAFLNTVLILAIQSYLFENAKHPIGILVIDSPILTLREKDDLKEREDKKIDDTMKAGIIKSLIEFKYANQVIIIENEIPKLNYDNVNLIQFTRDENVGRFGLLKGVK